MSAGVPRSPLLGGPSNFPGKPSGPVETPSPIVIVDDEAALRALIAAFLESEGYTVIAARDGLDALEVVQQVQPGMLLVDLMMPRMDGPELITALREQGGELAETPVVLMSAVPHLVQSARRLGVDYLAKPFELDDLLDKVQHHTGLTHTPAAV